MASAAESPAPMIMIGSEFGVKPPIFTTRSSSLYQWTTFMVLQRIGRRCQTKDDSPAIYYRIERNAAVRYNIFFICLNKSLF